MLGPRGLVSWFQGTGVMHIISMMSLSGVSGIGQNTSSLISIHGMGLG